MRSTEAAQLPIYRFSPALPTPFEVEKNIGLAISDHAPIAIEAAIEIEVKTPDAKSSRIPLIGVSFNTLGSGSGLNYRKKKGSDTVELPTHDRTVEETDARIERIIATILKINHAKTCHYFTFQESGIRKQELIKILQSLGAGWKSYPAVEDCSTKKACPDLVLYDSHTLTLTAHAAIKGLIVRGSGESTPEEIIFTSSGGTQFALINVHWAHQNFPSITEQRIINLTTRYHAKGIPAILQGDFNIRFAKPHAGHAWLVTGTTPALFRIKQQTDAEYILPGADWTDAAIVISAAGRIKQVDTVILNPYTGAAITAEELQKIFAPFLDGQGKLKALLDAKTDGVAYEFKDLISVFQAREVCMPRACFSLGARWQGYVVADKTVADVNREITELKQALGLYWATNANNETFVQLLVNREGFELLKRAFPHDFIFNVMEDFSGNIDYSVSVEIEKFPQLYGYIYETFTLQARPVPLSSADSGMFAAQKSKPGDIKTVALRTAPLRTVPAAVYEIKSMLQNVHEDGHQVAVLRGKKEALIELSDPIRSLHPGTRIFIKLALANYFLRFHEYSAAEIITNMKGTMNAPPYLMRPSHFDTAINHYLEILRMLSMLNNAFSPMELGIIVAELSQLSKNVKKAYELYGHNMAQQFRCRDLASGGKVEDLLGNAEKYAQDNLTIMARFKCVMCCQEILTAAPVGVAVDIKSAAGDKGLMESLPKPDVELFTSATLGAKRLNDLIHSKQIFESAQIVIGIPLIEQLLVKTTEIHLDATQESNKCVLM